MDSGSDRAHHRAMTAPDLASLIATHKGSRSYERLAADCGGVVTGARLQQMVRDGIKTFPEPDRIRGLAQGLGTTVTEVVAAAARSLGLDVRYGQDPTALVIGGAGTLPATAREAITGVARELLAAYQVADPEEAMGNAQHPTPMNEAGDAGNNVHTLNRNDQRVDLDITGWAARPGTPGNMPDTTTGEESQIPGAEDEG